MLRCCCMESFDLNWSISDNQQCHWVLLQLLWWRWWWQRWRRHTVMVMSLSSNKPPREQSEWLRDRSESGFLSPPLRSALLAIVLSASSREHFIIFSLASALATFIDCFCIQFQQYLWYHIAWQFSLSLPSSLPLSLTPFLINASRIHQYRLAFQKSHRLIHIYFGVCVCVAYTTFIIISIIIFAVCFSVLLFFSSSFLAPFSFCLCLCRVRARARAHTHSVNT